MKHNKVEIIVSNPNSRHAEQRNHGFNTTRESAQKSTEIILIPNNNNNSLININS